MACRVCCVPVGEMKLLLLLLAVVLMVVAMTSGQQLCDNCNCQISSKTEPQAIYSLSLVCSTGTISWFGAAGAIRLELTPLLRGNFRACFLADSDNTHVKVSQEKPQIGSPTNYRMRVEETKTLQLDHLFTAGASSEEFCVDFTSSDPLLLYMEAVRTPGVAGVPKVLFHYDLEKVDAHALQNPMDECRPCTKVELLDSYCSMDFVVIGSLADIVHNDVTERSNITVAAKQVIHQRAPEFFRRLKRSDPHLTGHVTVPKRCGLRQSGGDFLLTGRYRLNSLTLHCASYLHEWRKVQHEVECSHV